MLSSKGHTPVKKYMNTVGLFDSNLDRSVCKVDTEGVYHIISCCEALVPQRNKFCSTSFVEPEG